MVRSLAFTLLITAPTLAQTNCSTECPKLDFVPISGHVLNAADGQPIVGAVVHYRGEGISFDAQDRMIDPPSIQGEVRTTADGSYTLPQLGAGNFHIRASAPGFLTAGYFAQEQIVGIKPMWPATKYDLRLQPDSLNLTPMSDAALANFALPQRGFSNREYLASAFTPDGNRLAFLARDTVGVPPVGDITFEPFHRCAAWVYDLKSGILSSELGLPPRACEGGGPIIWEGDTFYIPIPADFSPPVLQAASVKGRFVNLLPIANLPKPVQDTLTRITTERTGAQKAGIEGDLTNDGRFSVEQQYGEGRGSCGSLVVTPRQSGKAQRVAQACLYFTFLLDRNRDLMLYTQPTQTRYPNGEENIVAFDLNTARRRTFSVPSMNHEPELLAEQPLAGGGLRVAYTIHGDCDHNASDYSQPSQPDGELGNTPNQFSVCFITIPPPQAKAARTSAKTEPHP